MLEESFEEASLIYDFLATNYSSFFSSSDKQIAQQKLEKAMQIVAEEKQRRKNPLNPFPSNQPSQTNNSNNLFTKENAFFFFW